MQFACILRYPLAMAIIQVRDVSAKTHKRLQTKAKKDGKSLSEYLRKELEVLADQLTIDEWLDRVESREPVSGFDAAETIREARAEREAQLDSR